MSLTRISGNRIGSDGLLITGPGAAVRLDSAAPRRPVASGRRRRHADDRAPQEDDQDTVTLHEPDDGHGDEAPDPVEALRRGGFRRHA
jgi:hypothetical protein